MPLPLGPKFRLGRGEGGRRRDESRDDKECNGKRALHGRDFIILPPAAKNGYTQFFPLNF